MRVIPVIDLLNGVVVRGVAGRREAYRPIESQIAADSEPATIARAFADDFGFDTAYVADLEAIQHGCLSIDAWQQIAGAGLKLWLDAGVGKSASAQRIARVLDQAKMDARLVVGLESVESADELAAIRAACSSRLPIFSLDLMAGQPLTRIADWKNISPLELAHIAIAAGYRDLILLDLADVGTNAGTRTLELCRAIRAIGDPQMNLIAGGGVRSPADLRDLQSAGCDAALMASALHDKRLTPADIRQFTD
jgi:phosphoribosylformimino-5-aminoimidazole carboxamide ribotide isomerase